MFQITGGYLGLIDFIKIVRNSETVEISASCIQRTLKGFRFLKELSQERVIYGVNTGLGPMAQYQIRPEDYHQLQYNLIRSHAAGAGLPLDYESCRALMLVRLNTLALGNSGIKPELLYILAQFLNECIHPYIPEHGGVGASGDLVQLAHLALNLIGEGEVLVNGKRVPAAEILRQKEITPLIIEGREGLAILNGTSAMTGIGMLNCVHARTALELSISASALINELMESYDDHFSAELNQLKRHHGQQAIAAIMRKLLADSPRIRKRKDEKPESGDRFTEKVQEYYSLRCVPQILGPVLDTLNHAESVMLNEMNSVSDNPVMDNNYENIWHGGNFHGDYVSFEMDKLRIAITKLSMLTERQLNYLAADYLNEKLPKFLNPGKLGLNFGIQGIQFTATSTVAENQTLATSMYIHSIPTNADNQDVVSMGMNSALLTTRVINNCFQVLSVHWISLMRAYYLLPKQKGMASGTLEWVNIFSEYVQKPVENDKPLYVQIEALCEAFKNKNWTN
jgi:histidine ammonia-lyase